MNTPNTPRFSAFSGHRLLASGDALTVALAAQAAALNLGQDPGPVLVFDHGTGRAVDQDLRGTPDDLRARHAPVPEIPESPDGAELADPTRGPGRPRLGVVAREVTLLPRHWEWLSAQPGGASVALRKLVEDARRAATEKDRVRGAQEIAYRVMTALGGDLPNYEEATRALFAGDGGRFDTLITGWPADVAAFVRTLSAGAFGAPAA